MKPDRLNIRRLLAGLALVLLGLLSCSAYNVQAGNAPGQPAAAGALLQLDTQCDDQSSSQRLPRFARLMHDPQWMGYSSRMAAPDWNKNFYYDRYPQTVQLFLNPKSGDGRLRYSAEWLEYLRELQPNDNAAVWIARIAAGLFNPSGNVPIPILDLSQLKQEPVAESISSGGNVVKILETRNGSGRIEMIFMREAPPDPGYMNYRNFPWLVTKFTSISIDGELGNAGGIDVYFPNLAKQQEGYWVDLRRVEFFPPLPFCATARQDVLVLSSPGGLAKRVGILPAGGSASIREYLPQASDVWGRLDEGWVRLLYLDPAGYPVYPTSWQMETRPPILYP
ncbi:MAG: hypothetical protein KIS85_07920 [Anaerolineales bacterium]|nr:hypothetical protein [Anaerolineales bacterium]